MPDYFRTVKVKLHLLNCIKCGSELIRLWDMGESSFNEGGGECLDCHHKTRASMPCNVTDEQIAETWNRANDPSANITRLQSEIDIRRAEQRRIRNLVKFIERRRAAATAKEEI